MANLLFVDESGQDLTSSIVEVLAGVCVEDKNLWNLITEIKDWEEKYFGGTYPKEIKAARFLVASTFKKAVSLPAFDEEVGLELVGACFSLKEKAAKKHYVAVEQAKLVYVKRALEICHRYRCKVFATINRDKIQRHKLDEQYQNFLPKGYTYLLERFYYFLEDYQAQSAGILVFDELERSQCHILIHQIEQYFKKTIKGKQRASLIIPAPFFVHSDLTTIIQVADLVAYIISWGFRPKKGGGDQLRPELLPFVELIKPMRYRTKRDADDLESREVWSIIEV